jgi:hypothetical protein
MAGQRAVPLTEMRHHLPRVSRIGEELGGGPNSGGITSAGAPRILQFGLKFLF